MKKIDAITDKDWMDEGVKLAISTNLLCLTKPEYEDSGNSPLQWFGTNLIQELAKRGNTEICPLYGAHITSIDDYCYQLCRSIPWGFEMGRSTDAIYDVLLNFETEPKNRVFIWYDCHLLFKSDTELFKEIFERMIVAGYVNSIGESTHNYQVNQKNIFLFRDTKAEELADLMESKFYTPRLTATALYMKHEYEILEIK